MLTPEQAERARRELTTRSDKELGKLLLVNGFVCAVTGGKNADTIFAKLHRLVLEEIHRRSQKISGGLH